jgi:hypothetical protein
LLGLQGSINGFLGDGDTIEPGLGSSGKSVIEAEPNIHKCLGYTTEPWICGPDITKALRRLIFKLQRTWQKWDEKQRSEACKSLTSFGEDWIRGNGQYIWQNAWDIDRLWRGNQSWINSPPYCPPCATPPWCKNTVMVKKECFYAGSVNYILFGWMARLCGWSSRKRKTLIWLYKRNAANYKESQAWAKTGAMGWPSSIQHVPKSRRFKLCLPCPIPYQGPPFKFFWYPHGWI